MAVGAAGGRAEGRQAGGSCSGRVSCRCCSLALAAAQAGGWGGRRAPLACVPDVAIAVTWNASRHFFLIHSKGKVSLTL